MPVRDEGDGKARGLVDVVQRDLVAGNVELTTKAVAKGLHDRPFVFQRLGVFDVQFEECDCNDHSLRENRVQLLDLVGLDDVPDFHVLEPLDADTALEALAHFGNVVLEVAQ